MWTKLHTESQPPAPRCSHTATAVDAGVVVLGGGSVESDEARSPVDDVVLEHPSFRHFADAWLLRASDARWLPLEIEGGFTPRRGHSTVFDAA